MTMTVERANALTERMTARTLAIGTDEDALTKFPRTTKNNEPLAIEYHVASHLLRIATARKERARAAAVTAGIMFDPAEQPMPVGTGNALVFAGDLIEITVSVTTATTKLDMRGVTEDLIKHGIKQALLDRLVAKHTRTNQAPHKFMSSIATVGPSVSLTPDCLRSQPPLWRPRDERLCFVRL